MTYIVSAIGAEAARVRDDWETTLLCAESAERADQLSSRPIVHQQDNYCFEMLSLVSDYRYQVMFVELFCFSRLALILVNRLYR